MRRHTASLLFTAAALAAGPSAAAAQAAPAERGWPAAPDAAVRVLNLAGSTHVIGWDRDSVAVRATVPAAGRLYGGGSRAAVKLGVEPAAPGGDPPPALVEVRVPRGASVSVKSATADVRVEGLAGAVEIASVSGVIVVAGAPRQLSAESMAGSVTVEGPARLVRVRTAGGAASVAGDVDDLRVETVSGSVTVRARAPRQVRLESATGTVRYEGSLAPGAVFDAQTHEAPVTLVLDRAIRADVELTTFDGLLANRFGSAAARPSRGGKPLRFAVNGGGARVTVRTLKGDVTVLRR